MEGVVIWRGTEKREKKGGKRMAVKNRYLKLMFFYILSQPKRTLLIVNDMEAYYKRMKPSPSPPINVVDMENLPSDPVDRPRILEYDANQRDEIRRQYWLRGPYQPKNCSFPTTNGRRFVKGWFDKYNWLEYSMKADKAYCLCCYLFRDHIEHQGGSEAFVMDGFNSWKMTERLKDHVGHVNSFHNKALQKRESLKKPNESIVNAFHKQDEKSKKENRMRLSATISACRYCLKGALPFRGHDESETSIYKGNFLELMDLILFHNEELRNLPKAPGNIKLISPCIQKDVVKYFKQEVLECIFKDLGDDVFALLVDESSNISKRNKWLLCYDMLMHKDLLKRNLWALFISATSFNTVLDMQIQEFGDRFSEASTELLSCMSALNPRDSFSMFDSSKLIRLCEFYPKDFNSTDMIEFENELEIYHQSVLNDPKFKDLNGIDDLARVMVETRKNRTYPLLYRLLKLALVLPVATATVERCFSSMKIIKSNLRNRIGEEFLNACVICPVEREALVEVKDEDVIERVNNMRLRRGKI
ncbi:uncharacterized protein [Rutidosis leptorrhynchoides]|uniref:uncharacterized protein n=1 Tax=Rutidosis leptorrhynchoides TaxID=125765 RepID=UPI003A9A1D29